MVGRKISLAAFLCAKDRAAFSGVQAGSIPWKLASRILQLQKLNSTAHLNSTCTAPKVIKNKGTMGGPVEQERAREREREKP